MTRTQFRARFPEFKNATDALIDATLAEAALEIDVEVWADRYDAGHGFLTAHKLALSPFGQTARMVSAQGNTTYQKHFEDGVRQVTNGFRVL